MRVQQYHVPMGADMVLLTLSCLEGDIPAIGWYRRLKSSIRIR